MSESESENKNPNVDVALRRCELLGEQGRFKEARQEALAVLAIEPDNLPAARLLAYCHWALGDNSEAINVCEQTLAYCPTDIATLKTLGQIYRSMKLFEKSQAYFLDALNLDPEDENTHLNLSILYLAMEDPEAGLSYAQSGLEIAPDNPDLLVNQACAYWALNRHEEARNTCRTALELAPNNALYHYDYALFNESYNRQLALEHVKEALRLNPNDKRAQTLLVNLLQDENRLVAPLLKFIEEISRKQNEIASQEGRNVFLEYAALLALVIPLFLCYTLSIFLLRLTSSAKLLPPSWVKINNYSLFGLAVFVLLTGGIFTMVEFAQAKERAERQALVVTKANAGESFIRFRKQFVSGKKLSGSRQDFETLYQIEKERTPQNPERRLLTTFWLGIIEASLISPLKALAYFDEAEKLAEAACDRSDLDSRFRFICTQRLLQAYKNYVTGKSKTEPDRPDWLNTAGDIKRK